MKKVYAFILVLAMLLSLSVCSGLPSSSQTSEESHQVDDSQNAQEVRDDSKPSANAMPVDGEAEGSDEQSQTDPVKMMKKMILHLPAVFALSSRRLWILTRRFTRNTVSS